MIGFGEAIGLFFRNYVKFEGRASRAEFWWSALFQIIVYVILFIFAGIAEGFSESAGDDDLSGLSAIFILLMVFFYFLCWLPGLSIKIRRFHDLDQSGWLVLLFIIANALVFVSWFAQMIWYAMPGTKGPNQYGADPYAIDFNAEIFG